MVRERGRHGKVRGFWRADGGGVMPWRRKGAGMGATDGVFRRGDVAPALRAFLA
jgi:hypothetical protein